VRLWLTAVAAVVVFACSSVMNPEGSVHERVYFESPVQMVEFLYASIHDERYADAQRVFLDPADREPWRALAAKRESHPWAEDASARALVVGFAERLDGSIVLTAREEWTDGTFERPITCVPTPDGWRITDIEGVPCDRMAAP
jgi:hypothetical protein